MAATTSSLSRLRFPYNADKYDLDRTSFEEFLRRRFFVTQSFSIYGGVAGLYDFGPPGCAVKANLVSLWRNHFVLFDGMLEVDCTCLTPKPVLDASGHTSKFSDYMVRDVVTLHCYRADHLLKAHWKSLVDNPETKPEVVKDLSKLIAQIDNFSKEELVKYLREYQVKAPETGNDISEPQPFNLMFHTSIGPSGDTPGFLRPETAQGIFVNFKKLLEFNGGKTPFAAAQVGHAFRNEISPRAGLLRVREFPLAEIEYFVKPSHKTHVNFGLVADLCCPLLPAPNQLAGESSPLSPSLRDATEKKMIANEAIAYFMGRTYLFLRKCGIPHEHLRFRQHLRTEMAHYAADCWDAEIRTSYGWVEVVGHADRTCYDLSRHSEFAKTSLTAYEAFKDGPKMVPSVQVVPNKQALGKQYRKEAQLLFAHLTSLGQPSVVALRDAMAASGSVEVEVEGRKFKLVPELVSFKDTQEKITGETFIPHVIEPSYGIGRIIYCILEHAYWQRPEDKDRAVLSLPPMLAPIKVSLFPLLSTGIFTPLTNKIAGMLTSWNISCKVDETGQSIGRRYARTDELGIPFAITVDHTSLADGTVTLRDRDSCGQIRLPIEKLVETLARLSDETVTFGELRKVWPNVEPPKDD